MRIEPRSGEAPSAAAAVNDVMPVELFLPSLEHALRVSGIEVGCCLSAHLLDCAAQQWSTRRAIMSSTSAGAPATVLHPSARMSTDFRYLLASSLLPCVCRSLNCWSWRRGLRTQEAARRSHACSHPWRCH